MKWGVLVIIVALVFVAFVVASSMMGETGAVHTMPDGRTMDGSGMTGRDR